MKIIDLRSDTVTRPTPAMMKAMMAAPLGDDVLGDDPTVIKLQNETARLLGKQAGLFVPSGTMGNQLAIMTHTQPGDEVILDYESHIFRYEVAGAAVMSGVQFNALTGPGGVMTAEQIQDAIRPEDIHQPATTLVCLENTHNRAGGTIYPLEEIKKISALCKNNRIKMHLDGARLWNASVASGISAKRICQIFRFGDGLLLQGPGLSGGLGAGRRRKVHCQSGPLPQDDGRRHAPGRAAGRGRTVCP